MFSLIPFPYKLLISVVLFVALVGGVFFYGYSKGSIRADEKLAKFSAEKNAQIVELEQKNAKITNKVITEYVDRTNTIREKEYVYRDAATKSVPAQSNLSNGWVYVHDVSATSGDADPARASDATSSGIKDNTALLTVISNYSICQQNQAQLIELQKWIVENKEAAEEKKNK